MFLWIDIDCYECQVFSHLHPEFGNGPWIVISGEVIISCDYGAKSYGINRKDSEESARAKCPSLIVFRKTNAKVEFDDLERFRKKIELSIKNFIADELGNRVQFHWEGNEEGYLNIGDEVDLQMSNVVKHFEENSWKTNAKRIFGNDHTEAKNNFKNDYARFQIGENILAEILKRMEKDTGLMASGGIGVTKVIARLACPLNKPRGITVVTVRGLEQLFTLVRIIDAPGLKGTTGQKILNKWKKPGGKRLETVQDLKEHVPLKELRAEGYLKGNKHLYALMAHWENMEGSKKGHSDSKH